MPSPWESKYEALQVICWQSARTFHARERATERPVLLHRLDYAFAQAQELLTALKALRKAPGGDQLVIHLDTDCAQPYAITVFDPAFRNLHDWTLSKLQEFGKDSANESAQPARPVAAPALRRDDPEVFNTPPSATDIVRHGPQDREVAELHEPPSATNIVRHGPRRISEPVDEARSAPAGMALVVNAEAQRRQRAEEGSSVKAKPPAAPPDPSAAPQIAALEVQIRIWRGLAIFGLALATVLALLLGLIALLK